MKRLISASLAVAVMLASCSKESLMDSTLELSNQQISYSPYAGDSETKGTAVSSNTTFASVNKTFEVSAYSDVSKYFGFSTVTHSGSAWTNTDVMYWPNADATLHFGAYSPSSSAITNTAYSYYDADTNTDDTVYDYINSLSFDYTVNGTVGSQEDVMYAITDYTFTASTADADTDAVGLHFKHALTQVGFTATKSANLDVTVNSIKICNVVDNGTFTATSNTNNSGSITADQGSSVATSAGDVWDPATAAAYSDGGTTNLQNYAAAMASSDVSVSEATGSSSPTPLTSSTDVLMLLPQTLTAWDATATEESDTSAGTTDSGTGSYLAISCKITHADGVAAIIEGTIYVPFNTDGIMYGYTGEDVGGTNGWLPGYKLTYNLDFGGGYTIPGDTTTDPTPGTVPDPDDVVETLRAVTYSITVDDWIPVAGNSVTM